MDEGNISIVLLRSTLVLKKICGHDTIVVCGTCPTCGAKIDFLVTVYSDQTPEEAFEQFWRTVEIDCPRGEDYE
jgi:hypothetical protein